jgi:hypothetical protein
MLHAGGTRVSDLGADRGGAVAPVSGTSGTSRPEPRLDGMLRLGCRCARCASFETQEMLAGRFSRSRPLRKEAS